jgi:hypothetical protein
MAAIGFSLNACEKKEKAGKPTEEAANGILGTPIDIDNIPFGADMEKVKKTYGVELESITLREQPLQKATAAVKNKFAFGFSEGKLNRVVILFDGEAEPLKEEMSKLCENRLVGEAYGWYYLFDYKGKLFVELTNGNSSYSNYVAIYQKGKVPNPTWEKHYASAIDSWEQGASIEKIKEKIPNIEEVQPDDPNSYIAELLSIGVRIFHDYGDSEIPTAYRFYQGKLYRKSNENMVEVNPDIEATIEKLLAEKASKTAEPEVAYSLAFSEKGVEPFMIGGKVPAEAEGFVFQDYYEPESMREGKTVSKNGEDLFVFVIEEGTDKIDGIQIISDKIRTKENIGVGSTVEELKKVYKELDFHYNEFEQEARFFIEKGKYMMLFNFYSSDGKVKPSDKIARIYVREKM